MMFAIFVFEARILAQTFHKKIFRAFCESFLTEVIAVLAITMVFFIGLFTWVTIKDALGVVQSS